MFQNEDAWFQSFRNGRWKLNPNIACSNQFGSMSTNIFSKTPPLPVACQAPLVGLEQRNPWKILPAVRHNQIVGKMLQKLCHSRGARYPQFSRLVVVLVWGEILSGAWCAEQTFPAGTLIWDRRYGCPLSAQPLNHVEAPKEESTPSFNCSHKPHRSFDEKSPFFKHIFLLWKKLASI